MKIGIMGGTFNPIHNGHLIIARYAKEQYKLDRVIFMVSGNPPHKKDNHITDAKIRFEMTRLALEKDKDLEACDYEVNRKEYSYTANTLEYLKSLYPDDEIYFIIGGDSLRDFPKWYKPERITELCTILVYPRPGVDTDKEIDDIKNKYGKEVKKIHAPVFEISSTEIRKRLEEGKSVRHFIPDNVLEKYFLNKSEKDAKWN